MPGEPPRVDERRPRHTAAGVDDATVTHDQADAWLGVEHLSLTGHVYSPSLIIVSPALWNKLSDADKAAFREAGKAGSAAQRKKVNDDEREGIAQLRAAGMEVVTNVDGTAFRNAMTPVFGEFAKQYGADNIRRIQEVK